MAAPKRSLQMQLLEATDFISDLVIERLERQGWPTLTRSQSMVLAHLHDEPATPADLARRLRMTRQSMQKILEHLVDLDVVEMNPHPTDSRSKLATLTADGEPFAAAAVRIVDGLERRLEAAFGFDTMWTVRRVLSVDWQTLMATTADQKASGR